MKAFNQPIMIPVTLHGKALYQLIEKWPVPGYDATVPENSVWDGASVPRLLWWYMPPDGAHRGAALAHDYFYTLQGHLPSGVILTRHQADVVLHDLMIEAGVSRRKAGVVYNMVRRFGAKAWNSIEAITYLPPVTRPPAAIMSRKKRGLFSHIYAP